MAELSDMVRGFEGRESVLRMLMYAIRCPEVSAHALQRLRPEDFNPSTEADLQVVWVVAKAYWLSSGSTPTEQYMHDLSASVLQEQGYSEGPVHERIHTLIKGLYSVPREEWDVNYGMELLKAYLARKLTDAIQHVVMTNPGDSHRAMDLIQTEYHSRTIDESEEISPLDLDADSLLSSPRFPLHVPQLDMLLAGGLAASESIGVLAPSGGGKTLMAVQTAGSLAIHKEHCLYFTYEQPAKELRARFLAFLGRIPVARFENKRMRELDDDIRQKFEKLRQFSEYLTVVDKSSGGDSPLEVENRIRRAVDMGKKPRLVIIDWIWILVQRMADAAGKKSTELRHHLMSAMDAFKSMASKYQISFMILQQLSTEQAKKSANRKPEWFNSAEAGNFAWLLAYCFAVGKADSNGFCWLVGSKARNAKKQDVMQRLNGALQRFDVVDKDMVYKDGEGFIESDKADGFSRDDDDEENGSASAYNQVTDIM